MTLISSILCESKTKALGLVKKLTFIVFMLCLPQLPAQVVTSQIYGYTIDLPQMSEIADMTEDETSILFTHQLLPVQTAVKIWPQEDFKNSRECLSATQQKLSATGEISGVRWRNRECAVSRLTLDKKALGTPMEGWGCCIPLPDKKSYLTALSFAPSDRARDCEQFMLSVLDSIMPDSLSAKEAGLITAFAFPKTEKKEIILKISGKTIKTSLDKDDAQASQFVIDREFALFTLFAGQKCWKEAWQRFYRLIARDSAGRLKKVAFEIYQALMEDCRKESEDFPEAVLAQKLLTWTQNFSYERKSFSADRADFASLPSVLEGGGSDCDSRSMLLMIFYRYFGLDSIMLISTKYSHAMVGVCLPGRQGQTYPLDEKEYLFGETTAQNLTLGMLAQDMQDRKFWIPVEMYD